MKVFILMHKKHGHVVGVYLKKEECINAKEYLNAMFTNQTYEIIEKKIIL